MSVNVLTMAYGPASYVRMAKGLAQSIRLHAPETTIAIVTDREPRSLHRWFDVVVPVNHDYGPGLRQKLHLDRYSPFDRTLYIDSDFLVFRDLREIWDQFGGIPGLGLFGYHLGPGDTHYAIDDLPAYLAKLGLSRIVMTNTGLVHFDRSAATGTAFDTARELAADAERLGLRRHPAGFFNDEPIMGTVVELLGLPFAPVWLPWSADAVPAPLFTLGSFGTADMTGIDVRRGASRHGYFGEVVEPAAIHFNVDSQQSKVYDRELRRLAFGRLGRTPLPDVVTDLRWSVRRLASMRRRLVPHLRRVVGYVNGWPYSRFLRRVKPVTPTPLIEEMARRSRSPFTFVQVGSNDGQTGDPLFETVSRTEVRGLLLEPIPELFARLEATYAGKTGVTLLQVAVGEDERTREFHWVPPRPGDPVWIDQVGSFSRDVILSHDDEVPGIAARIQTLTVPCRTLASLVREHGLDRRIDLLHIDAEGADLAILRTIDLDAAWAPRGILYEQKHLGPEAADALALLHRAGYQTLDFGRDVFALRGAKGRLRALVRRTTRRRTAR